MENTQTDILLGSTSIYRAQLLDRLGLAFNTAKPVCDESAHAGELPENLAQRLAYTKAHSLKEAHPTSVIIGSDQVAAVGDTRFEKPGTPRAAREQLHAMRGESIVFYTALCVIAPSADQPLQGIDQTTVKLRNLSEAEINRYVDAEMPLDCAGSFKVEKLGITLFESVNTNDPTALIGLPLILLSTFLRQLGICLP